MSFPRGWRQRRAAAVARRELHSVGSSEYRKWANRRREMNMVGIGLVRLVEHHEKLVAELTEVQRRVTIKEYNASLVGDITATASDALLGLRARAAELPALMAAAAAAVEAETVRVEAARADIVARHNAEDAAHDAVVQRETAAEAAARRARDAILLPPDIDDIEPDAQTKPKKKANTH